MSDENLQQPNFAELANEINNQLQAITGSATALISIVPAESRNRVDQIISCATRAGSLVRNMARSKLSAPNKMKRLQLVKNLEPAPAHNFPDTVLVIDDEELVRYTVSVMLRRAGYRVLEANSGSEGIRLFEQERERIFCVFLDLSMPYMPGNLVYARLKSMQPDVVAFLMSGYSPEQALAEFKGEPIAGFIQKPFQLAEIMQAIDSAQGQQVSNL